MVAMSLKPPYELVQRVGMPGPVTSICWHPGINQILVGTGEQAKGWTTVLYNPDTSEKGALLCAGKKPRQPNPFDYQPPLVIHTPGALPMFRDDSWRKRKHMPDSGVRYNGLYFSLFCHAQMQINLCLVSNAAHMWYFARLVLGSKKIVGGEVRFVGCLHVHNHYGFVHNLDGRLCVKSYQVLTRTT
jgi:hypothetical protein